MCIRDRLYPSSSRKTLVEVLKKQYETIENAPNVHQSITLLSEENSATVTTGHQLCLMTGPLYFIYKIVSAINLVKQLKANYDNYNFVPIFWLASEDHDFNEINSISYAAYRLILHRFNNSPGNERIITKANSLMNILGLDINYFESDGYDNNPADLGNYIAEKYIEYGLLDGSNEQVDYVNQFYEPINEPLAPIFSGNPTISNPNRWQPLSLDIFVDQSGNILSETTPEFLGAEWGSVWPFGLNDEDLTEFQRNGDTYKVYHDPGAPPLIDDNEGEIFYGDFTGKIPVLDFQLTSDLSRYIYGNSRGADYAFRYNPNDPFDLSKSAVNSIWRAQLGFTYRFSL